MQRIFALALNDGIRNFQKSIDALEAKIGDAVLCQKLKQFTEGTEELKAAVRSE